MRADGDKLKDLRVPDSVYERTATKTEVLSGNAAGRLDSTTRAQSIKLALKSSPLA
jgi:hypothetical protein